MREQELDRSITLMKNGIRVGTGMLSGIKWTKRHKQCICFELRKGVRLNVYVGNDVVCLEASHE